MCCSPLCGLVEVDEPDHFYFTRWKKCSLTVNWLGGFALGWGGEVKPWNPPPEKMEDSVQHHRWAVNGRGKKRSHWFSHRQCVFSLSTQRWGYRAALTLPSLTPAHRKHPMYSMQGIITKNIPGTLTGAMKYICLRSETHNPSWPNVNANWTGIGLKVVSDNFVSPLCIQIYLPKATPFYPSN